ncbi:hypothetical protein CVU75_02220 [Candidatus Dependentiae bacterium HGW-Dependentiae-1]|nr:MAG: hypothetical protein CVU75_02220 [Candidatus Dependentiae bacterium HGW-Dependentiae-1]
MRVFKRGVFLCSMQKSFCYANLKASISCREFFVVNTYQEIILNTVLRYIPQTKVYLFGSRARKDNTPESDIDIALDAGKKIDSSVLSAIKEALEESIIPFTVDVVDMHTVSEDFKKQVLKDGIVWH